MIDLTKQARGGNESMWFVGLIVGLVVLGGAAFLVLPVPAHASTLTAPQVSAIIGLLRAFGVEQKTIDIVYAQLSPAPSTGSVAPSKPAPVEVGTVAPAQIVPTCTFSAKAQRNGVGQVWYAQFAWTYTDGASANITVDGQPAQLGIGWGGSLNMHPVLRSNNSIGQQGVHSFGLFAPTTFTLTVSKDGQQVSCDTIVVPPQN